MTRAGSEEVDRSTDGRDNSNNLTLERHQVATLRCHQVGRALVLVATEKPLKIRGSQSDGFRLRDPTPRFQSDLHGPARMRCGRKKGGQ